MTEPENKEGLTWEEWFQAAYVPAVTAFSEVAKLRKAWRDGEDPTEWRAYYSNQSGR